MAGILLMGYDTETGTVSEVPRLSGRQFRKSISDISKIHSEHEAPATFFLAGKTLASGAEYVKPLPDFSDLYDFQQHTYSHVLLKTVVLKDKENSPYARRPILYMPAAVRTEFRGV